MSVTVILAFSVQPERAEEFKLVLKGLLPDTRAYDGCQSVDVYQDQDNPGQIQLIENWESKAHQQRYQAWREETHVAEVVGPFMSGEPTFRFFDKQDI